MNIQTCPGAFQRAAPRSVSPFDAVVAVNLRHYREAAGKSQTDLAEALGVAYQQLQKYENATNRLSAGRAFQAAAFLGVPVSALFIGCADEASMAGEGA